MSAAAIAPDIRGALAANEMRHSQVRDDRGRQLMVALAAGGYLVTRTAAGALLIEDNHGAPIAVLRVMP